MPIYFITKKQENRMSDFYYLNLLRILDLYFGRSKRDIIRECEAYEQLFLWREGKQSPKKYLILND